MPPKPSQSNKITDVFKVKRKPGRPRNTTLDTIVETGGGKKAKNESAKRFLRWSSAADETAR